MLRALFLFLAASVAINAADTTKTIVFFGDSLTAGYGLEDNSLAFPGLVQRRIDDRQLPYRVINAGLSGETTAGGLRRIDWVLRQPVAIFVLELGGNDGLRGVSPSSTEKNLQAIIDKVREKHPGVRIVLGGMFMPPNMGEAYTQEFAAIYPRLAEKNKLTFIPFILQSVGGVPELNLPDQIHPNAQGHAVVADTVWQALEPLLGPSPKPASQHAPSS